MNTAYAVFEGGGVKGIALVGALARFEMEGVRFRGFAGSSAGAIVAALAAAGYPAVHAPASGFQDPGPADINKPVGPDNPVPSSLKQILCSMDYMRFVTNGGAGGAIELARLRSLMGELEQLFPQLKAAATDIEKLRYYKLVACAKTYLKHKPLYHRLVDMYKSSNILFDRLGFYSTDYFVNWVRWHLRARGAVDQHGDVTFGSLLERTTTGQGDGPVLKVVAADLRGKRIEVFQPSLWAGMDVALAVQASMSIPIVFRPYPYSNSFLVDGGLLSNFPAWVFDNEANKGRGDVAVVGFRLITPEGPSQAIDSFQGYARALYETALEGTDELQVRRIDGLISVLIHTPQGVSATKFDLTPNDRLRLWTSGVQTADRVLNDKTVRKSLGLPQTVPPLLPQLLEL